VLAEGGNAVEAAIAIAATLCVVYPHFTGLGGDAFWLIADPDGAVQAISGIGQAAQAVDGYAEGIPVRGPRSALTSAAAVDSWAQAQAHSPGTGRAAGLVPPARTGRGPGLGGLSRLGLAGLVGAAAGR
jgi:gamma-glutamyltranspeptidase